ncbi:MAG: hypothetical protein KAU17_12640 [Spirochaetales bacterium]|nr:hypothetical protein [Spirochaetales bacterium]
MSPINYKNSGIIQKLRKSNGGSVAKEVTGQPELLSNGFERLLKSSICYGHLHKHGDFPNVKEIKTHNISSLLL